jgi:hypothetical protein
MHGLIEYKTAPILAISQLKKRALLKALFLFSEIIFSCELDQLVLCI